MHTWYRKYFPGRGEYQELASDHNTGPFFYPTISGTPYCIHCSKKVYRPILQGFYRNPVRNVCILSFPISVCWGKNRHLYLLRRDAFSFHQVQFVIFIETQWHVSVYWSTGNYMINKALCLYKNKTTWHKKCLTRRHFSILCK